MSFNTIIEAEKEAENNIISVKERAKEMISEVLSKQATAIDNAKIQGQKKLEVDLANFQSSLKTKIETENKNNENEISAFEQSVLKKKDAVVKHIVSRFK